MNGAPVCAGCGLIRGHGWTNRAGNELIEHDPAPDDPGIWLGSTWVCTVECGEHIEADPAILATCDRERPRRPLGWAARLYNAGEPPELATSSKPIEP